LHQLEQLVHALLDFARASFLHFEADAMFCRTVMWRKSA